MIEKEEGEDITESLTKNIYKEKDIEDYTGIKIYKEIDYISQNNYYAEKFGDGFSFAYRFPGWQKVLQAVGRVIRTETDTGFALLIDERLEKPDYIMLFPDHWKI